MGKAGDFDHLQDGRPYKGTAHRGSRFDDERFLLRRESMPGIFFASDPEYAATFGDYVHECEVTMDNPHVAREDGGEFIKARQELIERGYDGLIMIFENDFFVVPLHSEQVVPLNVTRVRKIDWGDEETGSAQAYRALP